MHFALLPAHVPVSVRWFERAIEDNHFIWLVSGERFFVRVVPLLFGICVYLATRHTQTESSVAAIWPANGLLLAALLLSDSYRVRLHTLAACCGINIIVNLAVGHSLGVSLSFAGINAAEAIIALYLLDSLLVDDLDFCELRTVVKFIGACLAAAAAPAAVGAALVTTLAGADYGTAFSTWYMADALGLLVITPAFALAFRPGVSGPNAPASRVILLFSALAIVCGVVFGQTSVPLTFLVTPVCVAIAFQLGPRYAALATLLLSAVSIYATYKGYGPAALNHTGDGASRVWLVQLLCLVNLFTALFVAAAVAERDAMRKRVEQLSAANQNSRRTLDAALDAMNQGLCIFDKELRIVARNDRFLQMYALSGQDVTIGLPFESLVKLCADSKSSMPVAEGALPVLANGDVDQLLSDNRTIRISQRRTQNGVICTYTDITVDRQAEDALRHISLHDPLTGLPNRRFFADELSRLCDASHADDAFCVMLIDVDHFKHVNDTLGHAAGDELLKIVGARLTSCVREFDTVARIGGDEFAIILRDGGEALLAHDVARRILEAVKRPVTIDGNVELISLSIGVARKEPDINPDALMKRADVALYAVKESGRNNVEVFVIAQDTGIGHRADSEAA
jgi:diguanylate cyclase (GGDEF)-like protein